jgi:hypothetical protein
MLKNVMQILSLQAFKTRHDDPRIHFSKKVGKKPFLVVILGHQQIKYAKARFHGEKLELIKSASAFVDNFQTAELDTAWVSDMLTEAAECKNVIIGINSVFAHLKAYPKDAKLKEITQNFEKQLETEVGKSYEKLTQYFLSQAGDQITLNGIERDKIVKATEKFTKWGFNVVSVFHYPTAVIAKFSQITQINWTTPGLLVYYSQKILFIFGWTDSEVTQLKSRLFSEAMRNPTSQKPMLTAIQKEINVAMDYIAAKAPGASINIYIYHDKQDATLAGLEALLKNSQPFNWPMDSVITDEKDYPDPDISIVTEVIKA